MKKVIENLTGSYKSSAKVVDGTLILSLPDAVTPTVWRLDLGQVKASALEVRKEDDDNFMLTLKTPKGDVHDIAPFDNRNKAVTALMAVSHAMENAQGQIKPLVFSANDIPGGGSQKYPVPALYKQSTAKPTLGKIAAGLVVLILLGFMINYLVNFGPKSYALSTQNGLEQASQVFGEDQQTAPKETTGVPVSADDFLRSR